MGGRGTRKRGKVCLLVCLFARLFSVFLLLCMCVRVST